MPVCSDVWTTVVVLVGMAGAVWFQELARRRSGHPHGPAADSCRSQVLRGTLPWLVDHMAVAPEAIYAEAMATAGVMNCHDIASRGVLGQQVRRDAYGCRRRRPHHGAPDHRAGGGAPRRNLRPVRCTIHLEPKEYVEDGITYTGAHG